MKPAPIIIGLVVMLAVGLLFYQFSAPGNFADNLGTFVQVALVGTLVGTAVLAQYRGSGTEAIRNLLIWLAIIGVIAFLYANKGALGF
jgi:hypothetical protein